MDKFKHTLYGFLPLLSITAAVAEFMRFRIYDDELITIILISVSVMTICFFHKSHCNNKLYIVCSTLNFIFSMRLLISSIMGLLTANEWTIEAVVSFSVCILTMGMFTVSLCGAFLLKQKTVHISVHILSIIHMAILTILSIVLYRDCLVFVSCFPLVLTNFIREYQINKEVGQNEAEGQV